jgi:tRNA nucleotidyltransferase (CCA-adding enzyme)
MTVDSAPHDDPRRHPERIPRPPDAVRWIVQTLERAGHEGWAVGGAVRDTLMGARGKDWDLTTSARPEQVRRLFRRTVPVGLEHGTVGVLARDGVLYEVTTFRRDVKTDGRHAVVAFADSVEEDLARRDFTINAIAWHPLRRELRDPYGGVDDLEAAVVRTVGVPQERFAEDYLRVLRALRFAGRFGMSVEPATWRALTEARGELVRLSPERVRDELLKVLGAQRPSSGIALYAASGVTDVLLPELSPLRGGDGASTGDPWARRLLVADALSPLRPLERLGALLQAPPGAGTGVEEARRRGVARALGLLERLRFSNQQTREVAALVDAAGYPPPEGAGDAELRRWVSKTGRIPLRSLGRLWLAGARVDRRMAEIRAEPVVERIRALRRVARSGAPLSIEELVLDGRGLIRMGLKPGPRFGRILEHLLDRVLEDPARNDRDALEEEVRRWLAGREGAHG